MHSQEIMKTPKLGLSFEVGSSLKYRNNNCSCLRPQNYMDVDPLLKTFKQKDQNRALARSYRVDRLLHLNSELG